jgi:hypothetical protein
MCITSTAVMVAGVTSSGGLTALAVKYLQVGNVVAIFKNKKKPREEKYNGYVGYEQDAKSESDVAGAVACGTKAVADEGKGIHEAA